MIYVQWINYSYYKIKYRTVLILNVIFCSFLGFSKPFNADQHNGIFQTLHNRGFYGKLHIIIQKFLNELTYQRPHCKLLLAHSYLKSQYLVSTLFNWFTNNIVEEITRLVKSFPLTIFCNLSNYPNIS